MNMLEIAFSIDWFLTVPGILITCGVILLIIALVMFIVATSKGKSEKAVPSVLEDKSVADDIVNDTLPVVETVPSVEEIPVVNQNIEEINSEVTALDDTIPTFDIIMPDDISDSIPGVIEPVVDQESIETISPVAEIEIPSEIGVPSNIEMPVFEEVPTEIITEVSQVENEHRPIYGGADPLEATQALPKIDVHHEPYSGGFTETKEQDIELDKVEQVVNNMPLGDDIPTIETVPEFAETEENSFEEEEIPEIVSIPDDDVEQL